MEVLSTSGSSSFSMSNCCCRGLPGLFFGKFDLQSCCDEVVVSVNISSSPRTVILIGCLPGPVHLVVVSVNISSSPHTVILIGCLPGPVHLVVVSVNISSSPHTVILMGCLPGPVHIVVVSVDISSSPHCHLDRLSSRSCSSCGGQCQHQLLSSLSS